MHQLLFGFLLISAGSFFYFTVHRFAQAALAGGQDPRPRWDNLPGRLADVFVYFFAQKKVAESGPLHRSSRHHLFIFWGFLIITIATAEIFVSGLFPTLTLRRLPSLLAVPLWTAIDVMNLVVLLMIAWAAFRRLVIKPPLIPWSLDAGLILGAIASLMLTHFIFHSMHGAERLLAGEPLLPGAVISNALAEGLASIVTHQSAATFAQAGYWLHVLILLTFLNYLPYSKHIHLLGALPNIFFRNQSDRKLDLPKINLEDDTQWGVGSVSQFSWKSLIDTYACTECARCSNYCPAYATGKNLSPMQLIHDIRYEMIDVHARAEQRASLAKEVDDLTDYAHQLGHTDAHPHPELVRARAELAAVENAIASAPRLTGGRVAEETLWSCTTCGACQEVCPVFIEHPLKIIQMRQNLVLEQEKIPGELARAFRNLERQSNPWGIAAGERMAWAEGLDVPTIATNPDPEYILWIGCAGAFDERIKKQSRAMVKLLGMAHVNYAVLGHDEACTGDPARRAGNEMLFQQLAEQNISTLNEAKAKKVITSCPHCLHTLRHDYPQFGGNYEVIHHTKLLAHLVAEQRLVTNDNKLSSVTYHDSCYLGRWNGEFAAPRALLQATTASGHVSEMARSGKHGFCCGAGGGRMFMEEHGLRVNEHRTDEAIATGATTVAVACPFCSIMLTDGMKSKGKDESIAVLDIAEILAERVDVPLASLAPRRKSSHPS